MNTIRHFLLAMQFFTRIPITGGLAKWVGFSEELQTNSLNYLPLIGLFIGGVTAAVFYICAKFLPAVSGSMWIGSLMAVLASVLLTGALHEDGLADLVDGLGGAMSRERVLEIMKDSRIGSFGAIALFFGLFAKILFLVTLTQIHFYLAIFTIIFAAVYSRYLVLLLMHHLVYVGNLQDSKSKGFVKERSRMTLLIATFIFCILSSGLYWAYPASVWIGGLIMALITYFLILKLLLHKLGGYNGDALGATQQFTEMSFYLGTLFSVNLLAK